jgi:hypothetical protein
VAGGPTPAECLALDLRPVGRVPGGLAGGRQRVAGDELAARADLERGRGDRQAHLHQLPGKLGRDRVGGAIHLHQRHPADPAGLAPGGVVAHPGQRAKQGPLACQAVGGWLAGCPVRPRVDDRGQPRSSPGVQLGDRAGRVEHQLLQEGLLELAEGPLDLALAGGVPGPAAREREPVGGGELARRWVQHQPWVGTRDQRAHVVDPDPPWYAAGVLEAAHQALQRVRAVGRGGKPPEAVA